MVERRARAGFTLVEVMVSVLVMGILLAGISRILSTARDTRDIIHNIQEEQLTGPAILDLVERDLRAIFTTSLPRELHLRVKNDVILGEDADRIDFFATTDSLLWTSEGDRHMRADVTEVGYCLRTSPEDNDFLEMYRREDFGIDEEPQAGGQYVFLTDRVVSFDVTVYPDDGPEADTEPLEEWGVDPNDPDHSGLPASVHLRLEIETEPRLLYETQAMYRTRQKRIFERIVRLPQSLRVEPDQVARLAIPTQPGSAGASSEIQDGGEEGGASETGGNGGTGGTGSGATEQPGGASGGNR